MSDNLKTKLVSIPRESLQATRKVLNDESLGKVFHSLCTVIFDDKDTSNSLNNTEYAMYELIMDGIGRTGQSYLDRTKGLKKGGNK